MERIVILGGGFGGVRTALDLAKKVGDKTNITLVDRNSCHLFVPDLYEVASAFGVKQDPYMLKLRSAISIPFEEIFNNKKISFIQAEIQGMSIGDRQVQISGGENIEYDYLVLAMGGEAADFGIPGVMDYAYKFKTIDDGIMINKKLEEILETGKDGNLKTPVKIQVIGAGFTGIELAAEISCCSKLIARKCKLGKNCFTISLFERGNKILPMVSDSEREFIIRRLTKLGVKIITEAVIEEVSEDYIKLNDGRKIESDLIIWTAGAKPNSILSKANNLPLNEKGLIKVEKNLKVENLDNIFAIGDNITFIDPKTQKPVPALAYTAVDEGKIVAKNLVNVINNKQPVFEYEPKYNIWVSPIGGKYALAHMWKGTQFKGFWGWGVRQLIDIRYLTSILPLGKAWSLFLKELWMFTKND